MQTTARVTGRDWADTACKWLPRWILFSFLIRGSGLLEAPPERLILAEWLQFVVRNHVFFEMEAHALSSGTIRNNLCRFLEF